MPLHISVSGAFLVDGQAVGKLIAAGLAEPPSEQGDPTEGWPALRLPRGTTAALIDADRGE